MKNYFQISSSMPPAARGALFEKTAPLDLPQKLLIKKMNHPPNTTFPHYPKSLSRLTSFSHLPLFSASQLPSLPPGRRR
jgi:hypothetical protein